jgi:hypothetical protein
VIRFLLEEIEKSPNPSFTKKELLYISGEEFKDLLDKKILVYCKSSTEDIKTLRYPRCRHGCGLTLMKINGLYEAVCLEHPEEAPIPLEKDDLSRYKVSIDQLIFEIKSANRIDGDMNRIKSGYYYVGHKNYNNNRVGIVFALNSRKIGIVNLSGLKSLCKDDNILLVLTPVSEISDVVLKKQLANEKIIQLSLATSIKFGSFQLPIQENVSTLLKGNGFTLAELSAKQKKDYEKFEYLCYDKIHIPGTISMKRSNILIVNGSEIKIGDSLFRLFLRFVLELKKKEGGWIDRLTLGSDRVVSNPDSFQVYGNLRTKIEGSLLVKEGQKFIQSDGSKNYRISTHPDFITYDKRILRNHPDNTIREIAKKLP